jgi:hypothetical protein
MTNIPPADLGYIQETLHGVARDVLEAFEDSNKPSGAHTTPVVLMESLERLLGLLARYQSLPTNVAAEEDAIPLEARNISSLADYGIQLFSDLAAWARNLQLPNAYDDLRRLSFAFGLWLVQHGAEISTLEPLVDHLAFVANGLRSPTDLEQMYVVVSQIMEAVDPLLAQDLDRSRPERPWRILVLNRAIIATRSHQPALMEQAFQALVELLPEDAPAFFREGMEQMDALQYPEAIREVMEKYSQMWCTPKTLH